MATKSVKIPNINCGHCTNTIEQEVSELEGITSVKANKESKMVNIEWNEPPLTWVQIAALLTDIGYPAEV